MAPKKSDAPTCETCGAVHPERVLGLLHERESSLIHAGLDEHGDPFLIIEPCAELSDTQRETLAILMVNAASGLLGGASGGVVH